MFKSRILDAYEKFLVTVAGPQLRSIGQRLNALGITVQGTLAADDRLVPSLRSKAFEANSPQLGYSNFIAPNSVIIGQVSLGEKSSVWYGSTIRGDQSEINIGKNTVLQDLVTLLPKRQTPIKVGDNVYVGPNSVLESCTIENNAFIGMGASVQSGAKVESYGVVAAGAVILENTTVPAYQIWAGNPAKYLRDLTNEEKDVLEEFHTEIQSLAKVHAEEAEKPFRQILNDLDNEAEKECLDPEEIALLKMQELGFPMEAEDEDLIEQRVFFKEKDAPEEQHWKKHYDPYEQDVFNFPDNFKVYGENYEKYDELKKFFEENPHAEFKPVDMDLRQEVKDQSPWTRKF